MGTSTDVARELESVQSAVCGRKLQATKPASHVCLCCVRGRRHFGEGSAACVRVSLEPKGCFHSLSVCHRKKKSGTQSVSQRNIINIFFNTGLCIIHTRSEGQQTSDLFRILLHASKSMHATTRARRAQGALFVLWHALEARSWRLDARSWRARGALVARSEEIEP